MIRGLVWRDGLLAVWFVLFDLYYLRTLSGDSFLLDARIYRAGSAAWLAGNDPWGASVMALHFAALPPVVPLLAPLAILPDPVWGPLWLVLCVASGLVIVRRLRLNSVWLLFPPLMQGVLLGNPAIPAFALFVCGGEPIALLVRPHLGFAALTERRWVAIGFAVGLALVSFAVAPWRTYVSELPVIAARYAAEGGEGADGPAILYWVAVAATAGVFVLDHRRGGWLACATIPAPIAYHGLVSIMPIPNRLLAAVAAVPLPGVTAVVAVVALGQNLFAAARQKAGLLFVILNS
jgi:hypothetical protein